MRITTSETASDIHERGIVLDDLLTNATGKFIMVQHPEIVEAVLFPSWQKHDVELHNLRQKMELDLQCVLGGGIVRNCNNGETPDSITPEKIEVEFNSDRLRTLLQRDRPAEEIQTTLLLQARLHISALLRSVLQCRRDNEITRRRV